MDGAVRAVLRLSGGLAMFLFAMEGMSDALEQAAGPGLRRVLAAATKTPLLGALAGALVTAVLHSSSAATVMVIGFVSAGLMDLDRAVPVLFGANLGATVTVQLLAFQPGAYIYPLLLAGTLLHLLAGDRRAKSAGAALFFCGLLFEGAGLMGGAMEPLAASPLFARLAARATNAPLLGTALGAAVTALVQSSSAVMAALQRLAAAPGPDGVSSMLGLSGAIPILLGCNIGTTVTAQLAAAGRTVNARRAALAHTLFNLSGTLLLLPLLPAFTRLVVRLSPAGPEADVIARQLANAHTLFNAVCTLLWLPLTGLMVRLVTAAVPDRTGPRAEAYKNSAALR